MRIHYSFFLPIVCLVAACTPAATIDRERLPEQVVAAIDEVRTQYTPDQRVALLDTRGTALTTGRKNHIVLRGVTTSTEAKVSLSENLAKAGYTVTDSLRVLPDARSLNDKVYGIVNLSVINIRSAADYSSEMVTQALLGMPVRLLQRDGWLRLQTPDNYIGWTHSTSVTPMTKAEYDAWNRSEKLVVTAHYGFAYAAPTLASQTVGDVVAGNRFRLLGVSGYFYHVAYPDGKRAYIPHTLAIPEHEWRTSLKQDATSIIATAHTLMGIPYLWAGTSSKGVDCSGFMRTILYMHDIILPRDASQMCLVGEKIEILADFSNLKPGDLLFFGRKATAESRERVVHVGMYIGNKRFIHSQGYVHVSSFDPTDELYDEYNLKRMLFATRFLNHINQVPEINTTDVNPYYLP